MGVYIDGSDGPTVDDDIPAVLRLRSVYQATCDKRDAGDSAAGAVEQVSLRVVMFSSPASPRAYRETLQIFARR